MPFALRTKSHADGNLVSPQCDREGHDCINACERKNKGGERKGANQLRHDAARSLGGGENVRHGTHLVESELRINFRDGVTNGPDDLFGRYRRAHNDGAAGGDDAGLR